jgi:hypothetical protein
MVIMIGIASHERMYAVYEPLDVMYDFAYPRSDIEEVRNEVCQAVYALHHADEKLAEDHLQQACQYVARSYHGRSHVTQEDRDFLENMLQKIDDLIYALESSDSGRAYDYEQLRGYVNQLSAV